ncbi:BTB/POZ domain-containing protein 1-like [Paramacrobiotus metropolitanus]|uniref:BTB/POZ domain-containing protein 1-like n=1 Tax=Paramacrobiotus metropolitanus TaxID=2943436 RepID=UPI0024463C1F|nr:BTB/POZ domain-containing protein 1-like [Paramacrobiotus metropolitanus]
MASTHPPSSTLPAAGLNGRIKQTLATGELSDVKFSVGRDFGLGYVQVFPAHKYIVCIRSAVFQAMFYGSVPETGPQVDIPDCMPEAFANMLSFMYTEAVENLTVDNVIATMRCADKYDVPQLTSKCAGFITTHLNRDNCLTLLEQAIYWRVDDDIVETCLKKLEWESNAILQSEQFTTITQGTLKMILQRNRLCTPENAIYMAVERWTVEACNRQVLEPSTANRRAVLGEALFLVRFPLLTGAQLTAGPGKEGGRLLLDSELLSIFLYQNGATSTPLPFRTDPREPVDLSHIKLPPIIEINFPISVSDLWQQPSVQRAAKRPRKRRRPNRQVAWW